MSIADRARTKGIQRRLGVSPWWIHRFGWNLRSGMHGEARPLVLRGDARFLRRPTIAGLVLWTLASIGVIASIDPITDVAMTLVGLVGALAAAPMILVHLGLVPAELRLDADRMRLVSLGGRTIRELQGGVVVGAGPLRALRIKPGTSPEVDAGADDVRVGSYLRLAGDGGVVTVGALGTVGVERRWSTEGWTRSPARRDWDITVDRTSFVALEYHLASLGLLRPNADPPHG